MNAKYRATNENLPCWKFYGERGIKFLLDSVELFYLELGPRPSPEYSLDRISPLGHYELGNLRWATRGVQQANRRGQWNVWEQEVEPGPDDMPWDDPKILFHATFYCPVNNS
jgi:hypothetical protein